MHRKTILLLLLTVITHCMAQDRLTGLMPYPKNVVQQAGKFRLTPDLKAAIITDPQDDILSSSVNRIFQGLNRKTRLFFRQGTITPGGSTDGAGLIIRADRKATFRQGMDESYTLDIDDRGIRLHAPNSIGAVRGLETLQQLLARDSAGSYFPHVHIEDAPRFVWRGLMLDVARHFIPTDVVKRNIDAMATVKMNVLHLHLTDDEGFRIESKSFPKLHTEGSGGRFYTQEQMKDIIGYARLRGIMVVPEFDLPGHSRSWFAGHPELASAPGPYVPGPRFNMSGDQNGSLNLAALMSAPTPTIDPTKEETYRFLDRLFTEMAALFPSPYFHIGADENNGVAWKNNPAIVAFMKQKNISDVHALQEYFVTRVHAIVKKNGKTMMGWEELYNPRLPKEVVVQKWIPDMGFMKGKVGAVEVAEKGNPVVISQGFYTDVFMPAHVHYNNPGLPAASNPLIWGGEAAQWTEVADADNIERRIWPRAGVIAERLWSPATLTGNEQMYERMFVLEKQLDEQGLQHIASTERSLRYHAANGEYSELRTLTNVLVPVRGYRNLFGRISNPTMLTNSASPLNDIGDIISTDPEAKRIFRNDVAAWLKSEDPSREARIRKQLQEWASTGKALAQHNSKGRSYASILPHAANLDALAGWGLKAMDNRKAGRTFSDPELAEFQKLATASKKAYGLTELDIVSEIESLVRQKLIPEPEQFPLM